MKACFMPEVQKLYFPLTQPLYSHNVSFLGFFHSFTVFTDSFPINSNSNFSWFKSTISKSGNLHLC